jgi:putative transposase
VHSQSVKTTGVGGEQRGYDGGKKVKGRKPHLLVDTEGFVLRAKVHSAKVMDYEGIKVMLESRQRAAPAPFSAMDGRRLHRRGQGRRLGAKDAGMESRDRQPTTQARSQGSADGLGAGVGRRRCDSGLAEAPATAGVRRPATSVGGRERTFSWISKNRRMSRDYERLAATSEAFIYIATMTRLMVRRLARAQ